MRTEDELIDLYAKAYPFLKHLAGRRPDFRAYKQLGDTISRLALPSVISGEELLVISRIGITPRKETK